MYTRYRRRAGIVWLLVILVGTIAAGKAWALALLVFVFATIFFLGMEKLVKAVLGHQT